MTTAIFDTLKASDTLKAAGIEAKQAEAIVHTMAGAFEDTVATKADLAEVKADLKTEIAAVRAEVAEVKAEVTGLKSELKATSTRSDVAELKSDMLKVSMGVAVAIILANATMTIALIRFLS